MATCCFRNRLRAKKSLQSDTGFAGAAEVKRSEWMIRASSLQVLVL